LKEPLKEHIQEIKENKTDKNTDGKETEDKTEEKESDSESKMKRHTSKGTKKKHARTRVFTIKDIENNIAHFLDDDKLSIEKWFCDYKDRSFLFEWNELQKVIYGKRFLKDLAKKFITYVVFYHIH